MSPLPVADDLSLLYIVEIKTAGRGGQTCRIESWSRDDGIEKEGRARDPDIFLPVSKRDRLAEVIFFRLRVAGENSVFAVFGADVVEEEIAMRGFVVCPASKSDAAAVTRAAIGGD